MHAKNLARRIAPRMVAALLLLVLAGCDDDWSWNQKLSVEVTTPDGVSSGSAVSHVGWNDADIFDNYHANFNGEATVVDLGEGRYLFALIGEATKQIAAFTLHDELGVRRNDYPALFPRIEAFRGVRDVPRKRYPLLVTFSDIGNPKTVTKVDPGNLAATFGPGVSLLGITLEITDEAVTEAEIEALLPWLESVGTERATLIPNPPRLATNLHDSEIQLLAPDAFSTELYK